jgi:hypothetical protein
MFYSVFFRTAHVRGLAKGFHPDSSDLFTLRNAATSLGVGRIFPEWRPWGFSEVRILEKNMFKE